MGNVNARLDKGYRTTIKVGDHVWYADEPEDNGGTNAGPTPTDMAIGALGACVAITLRLYAERKEWPLEAVEIDVDYERLRAKDYEAYDGPENFVHEIRKAIKLVGPLSDEQRERLMEIAGKCPVHRLIALPSFFKETLVEDDETPA